MNSFIESGYFFSTSSSSLLLRGAPNYSIHTVSELTDRSAATFRTEQPRPELSELYTRNNFILAKYQQDIDNI